MTDLRYAARALRRSPGFSAIAILTLALGVGANTAIFCLINAVLLRPLPFPQPDRLALVWEDTAIFGLKDSPVSLANYVDWRARNRSFQSMGTLEENAYRLTGAGEPMIIRGAVVSASLFPTLGVQPVLGRAFREDEDRPGAAKTAVISNGLWRRAFGADPAIVGKTVMLDHAAYSIAGVMPASYRFPSTETEAWVPLGARYPASEFANRGRHNFMVVGRLAPGVTLRQANADLGAIAKQLEQEFPRTNRNLGAFVAPMRDHFVGDARTILAALAGAVGFVLLIACVNVANLLLARAAGRTREIAIRAAVGAGRRQLVRQLLTENLLLASAGGVCGLALAWWGSVFLKTLVPKAAAGLTSLTLDGRVLGFTLAVTLLTGLAFGLVPALQTLRVDLQNALKQGGRSGSGGSRAVERALVIAEVALAFVLTVGAGLMIQTFVRLRNVDPGFQTRHLLTARVAMPETLYRNATRRDAFYSDAVRRLEALPGVTSAGFTNGVPIAFKGWFNGFKLEDGREGTSNYRVVTPDYAAAIGLPLRKGRQIDARDGMDAAPVVLVNESFERKFWPGANAVGKRIWFGAWVTVVGVVGDIHQAGLDAPPKPEVYLSAAQNPTAATWLAVRTSGDPAMLAAAVRHELRAMDPELVVRDISTMENVLDREVGDRRTQMLLLGAFAGVAVLLASIGIYGVLAYLVAQRTREIGIRMALGAKPADVLRSVAGQGIGLAFSGVAIGVLGALAATRILAKLLFGIGATDAATFVSVAALLLLVASAASYLPARRAMRVDPILALREQ
jgi:predicted permease